MPVRVSPELNEAMDSLNTLTRSYRRFRMRSSIAAFDREVADNDRVALLANPVNATNALLDAHRVPGQVVVEHHTRELKIDAFAAARVGRFDPRSP